jgi:hypothetical protein
MTNTHFFTSMNTNNNPQFINQIMSLDASQLNLLARQQLENYNNTMRANQARRQPTGTQNNPIEIATPVQATPQLPGQNALPLNAFQTPQTQLSQPNLQAFNGVQNPTPPQRPAMVQRSSQLRPQPWDSLDLSKEPFTLTEQQFLSYLNNLFAKKGEVFVNPTIENKKVDLYKLFSLVHKNGGYAKVNTKLLLLY